MSGATLDPRYPGYAVLPGGSYCVDPRSEAALDSPHPTCPQWLLASFDVAYGDVALTPVGEFGVQPPWNVWVDSRLVGVNDTRYGLDMESLAGTVAFGIDRQLTENVVAGASFSVQDGSTDGFDGSWHSTLQGLSIGPYLAVRLSPRWALDTGITYSQARTDLALASLDGDYVTRQVSGNLNLHGQYTFGAVAVRPKLSVYYGHSWADDYLMRGEVLGRDVTVAFPDTAFDTGYIEASTEISRIFLTPAGRPIMPFAEFGAHYDFERPDGGRILTGDLSLTTPSPWAFSVRSGFRTLVADATFIEASGGYLSLGQDGLDVWEGRLYLSVGF